MTAHTPIPHDGSPKSMSKLYPSWADRLEAFKGTPYLKQALLTISMEAAAEGYSQDNELSAVAYDAAMSPDADERQTMLEEVEEILAEYEAVEREDERLARAEMRRNPREPWLGRVSHHGRGW